MPVVKVLVAYFGTDILVAKDKKKRIPLIHAIINGQFEVQVLGVCWQEFHAESLSHGVSVM